MWNTHLSVSPKPRTVGSKDWVLIRSNTARFDGQSFTYCIHNDIARLRGMVRRRCFSFSPTLLMAACGVHPHARNKMHDASTSIVMCRSSKFLHALKAGRRSFQHFRDRCVSPRGQDGVRCAGNKTRQAYTTKHACSAQVTTRAAEWNLNACKLVRTPIRAALVTHFIHTMWARPRFVI